MPTILTVTRHSHSQAFLEATILTPVPVETYNGTLPIPKAAVLYLLLNAPSEETLGVEGELVQGFIINPVSISSNSIYVNFLFF